MADDFYFNASDLINLRKFYKQAPRQFQYAVASVLNDMAFGNRKRSVDIINDKMTVRNKGFVNSSLRVEKARGNKPIHRQHSVFGSIEKDRSTGFIEQETGKPMEKTRVASLFARGGSVRKQIRRGMRLTSSTDLMQPWDVVSKANNERHRVVIFLQVMSKKHKGKPFYLKRKYKKLNRGVYKFQRGKIKRIYDMQKKVRVPERVRWLSGGHEEYMKATDMRKVWSEAVKRQLKFRR